MHATKLYVRESCYAQVTFDCMHTHNISMKSTVSNTSACKAALKTYIKVQSLI